LIATGGRRDLISMLVSVLHIRILEYCKTGGGVRRCLPPCKVLPYVIQGSILMRLRVHILSLSQVLTLKLRLGKLHFYFSSVFIYDLICPERTQV
jgi:hypothetical protein